MDIIEKITAIIEPSLEALGYRLVLVRMADGGKRKTLTIMAERMDDEAMSFDDCVQISRTVGALLEVEDPIAGAYNLEVSSPGLDRPLTKPEDFSRFAGQEAKIEILIPLEGRKRFRGIIGKAAKDTVELRAEDGVFSIDMNNIRSAKLAGSDAQAAADSKKSKRKKHN